MYLEEVLNAYFLLDLKKRINIYFFKEESIKKYVNYTKVKLTYMKYKLHDRYLISTAHTSEAKQDFQIALSFESALLASLTMY